MNVARRMVCGRHLCVVGMGLGLLVDLLQSPTRSIPSICSGDIGLWAQLLLHVTMMPAAHCGMLLGGAFLILEINAVKRSKAVVRLIWQSLRMAAVEVAALVLFSPVTDPVSMMTAMACLMIALEHLSLREGRKCPAQVKGAMKVAHRPEQQSVIQYHLRAH